jgi:hypothetical protein
MTPHQGLALHNPWLLPADTLKGDFVARTAELQRLQDDLRRRHRSSSQHHLILGHRGMGKTTLLYRLACAVEDDHGLSSVYVPLVFAEEQYNVARLSDLWLNCLDALSDQLERRGDKDAARGLDRTIDQLHALRNDELLEERARTELLARARAMGRRFVLLLDNIDLVLDRIGAERQWAFRDALEHNQELVVIGASAAALEATWDYGKAFYDFFRVHRLAPLQASEVRQVLLALAERHGDERVRSIVTDQPGRVEALRVLAGGNPRTIVTLYSVLSAGPGDEVQRDLEGLLDRHTPLYKARFEALPAQAQLVMDALCLQWAPATARQLAEHTRLDVNAVSSQLARLQKDGQVEKVDRPGGAGRQAFQVSERFFNIWYLMRASRRSRRKLAWFVSFLEVLYGPLEVHAHAGRLLARPSDERPEQQAEMALALADGVKDDLVRMALHYRALEASRLSGGPVDLDHRDRRKVEKLEKERRHRVQKVERILSSMNAEEAAQARARVMGLRWLELPQEPAVWRSPASPEAGQLAVESWFLQLLVPHAHLELVRPLLEKGACLTDLDVLGQVAAGFNAEAAVMTAVRCAVLQLAIFSILIIQFRLIKHFPWNLNTDKFDTESLDRIVKILSCYNFDQYGEYLPLIRFTVDSLHKNFASAAGGIKTSLHGEPTPATTGFVLLAILLFAVDQKTALLLDHLDPDTTPLPILEAIRCLHTGELSNLPNLAPEVAAATVQTLLMLFALSGLQHLLPGLAAQLSAYQNQTSPRAL